MSTKPTNPKDRVGTLKVSMSHVPCEVLYELALAMMEGAMKYGRHNYRASGVRASVYFDATKRHIDAWWEGENFDPESKVGLHHVSKAIASLTVLRDAMLSGKLIDDRPPKLKDGWLNEMNAKAKALVESFPDPVAPYTQVDISWVDAATVDTSEQNQEAPQPSPHPELVENPNGRWLWALKDTDKRQPR